MYTLQCIIACLEHLVVSVSLQYIVLKLFTVVDIDYYIL